MTHLMIMHHTSKEHCFPYKSDTVTLKKLLMVTNMYSRHFNHLVLFFTNFVGNMGMDLILKNICYTYKGQEIYLDQMFFESISVRVGLNNWWKQNYLKF